jgi:hypothetical protein
MNTVDDLRATLSVHAAGEDTALLDRAAAVRSRVRVVRRRRRVGSVAALAAVLAVVVAATVVPRHGDEVVRYAGMPRMLTSGGFEYRLAQSGELAELHRRGRFDLVAPKDGRPVVAVITAEHLGSGTATLIDPNGIAVARLVGSGVSAPVPVFPLEDASDIPLTVQVSGAGPDTRVAVGGYRRTTALPKGVVDPSRSTVFRQRAAGRSLLDASFAEPGAAEATVRFTGALADVRVADFCSVPRGGSEDAGPWVHVSIDGKGFSSTTCGQPEEDASNGGGGAFYADDHQVEAHTARVWTSTTEGGGPVPVPGAVVGIGVYGPAPTVQVHGSTIDKVVEHDGRLWQLDRAIESTGGHELSTTWHELSAPLLVGYATEGTRRVSTGGSVPGSISLDGSAEDVADARASSLSGVLLPSTRSDLQSYTVRWPAKYTHASGAILVYRPLD